MTPSVPTKCANPQCEQPAIRQIHSYSQSVAIGAVDGPQVLVQHVTYRCAQCGHTWAVRGYASDSSVAQSRQTVGATAGVTSGASGGMRANSRGW